MRHVSLIPLLKSNFPFVLVEQSYFWHCSHLCQDDRRSRTNVLLTRSHLQKGGSIRLFGISQQCPGLSEWEETKHPWRKWTPLIEKITPWRKNHSPWLDPVEQMWQRGSWCLSLWKTGVLFPNMCSGPICMYTYVYSYCESSTHIFPSLYPSIIYIVPHSSHLKHHGS